MELLLLSRKDGRAPSSRPRSSRSRRATASLGLAVRCPACAALSVNLVSQAHVDLPFWNDDSVGVVDHVFADDVCATLEAFRAELYSARFDERRLNLEIAPTPFHPGRDASGRHRETEAEMIDFTRGDLDARRRGVAGFLIWLATQMGSGLGGRVLGDLRPDRGGGADDGALAAPRAAGRSGGGRGSRRASSCSASCPCSSPAAGSCSPASPPTSSTRRTGRATSASTPWSAISARCLAVIAFGIGLTFGFASTPPGHADVEPTWTSAVDEDAPRRARCRRTGRDDRDADEALTARARRRRDAVRRRP